MVAIDDSIHLYLLYALDGIAIIANLVLIFIIALRAVSLPDNKLAIVYLGQCSAIGGTTLCNICESMQLYFLLESSMLLLLSFGYRRYIIRTGTAYVRLPPRKVVWCWCLLAYLAMTPFWYFNFASFREPTVAISRDLRTFEGYPITWLYAFDKRVVIFVSFSVLFMPIATILMIFLRRSLLTHLSKMSRQAQLHHGYIIQALTFQMFLPIVIVVAVLAGFIDFPGSYWSQLPKRLIIVIGFNFFPLASPLINLIYLPSYRKVFTNSNGTSMLVFNDILVLIVLYTVDGAAIVANVVLLSVIVRRTPKSMRSYSIFLLNNAIIDICTALSSALIAERVLCLPGHRITFIYLGQCLEIGGMTLCHVCQSLHTFLMSVSIALLLLAFGYFALFLDMFEVYTGEFPQRLIIVSSSVFALISPIVNLTYLPPFRKVFSKTRTIEQNLCVSKDNSSLLPPLAHPSSSSLESRAMELDESQPKKGLSFKRLFVDFSKWCTVVCLNKIVTSVKWLAIIYTIVFIAMVGLFIFISVNLIIKYFKYPSSTELTINVKSQKFPRFSFCNENPLKRSIVDSDPAFAQIAKLMKQFDQLELKTLIKDDFGIGTSAMKMQRLSRTRTMLRLLMNQLSDADRIRGGYSFSELVAECRFAGKTCSSTDFTMFLHPDYGVCFTFTKDRDVTKAGSSMGLRMLMTVNQDSTRFSTFDFLPSSDSANVRGLIHLPEDHPDFTNDGFKIAAKTQASIAFSRVNRTRSPAPYDNCTREGQLGDNDYYSNFTYTFNSCQNSCLQRLAWEHCKCVDPLYKKGAEHTYCTTVADMLCLVNLPSKETEANDDKGRHVCDCHPPCVEQAFEQIVTYGIYPSGKYAVAVGTQKQRDLMLLGQNGGRSGVGDDYWEDYDNRWSTTTTTTKRPTTTTTLPPLTTRPPLCPPKLLSIEESIQAVGPWAVSECRANELFAHYFDNPKYTVIQGWPCLSGKKCKTCIMFAEPMPLWEWPCQYSGYEQCTYNNNNSSTSYQCSQFFAMFDFIPTGVNTPGIADWNIGKQPSDSACNRQAVGSTARSTCWLNGDCQRRPSTFATSLANSPLLDRDWALNMTLAGVTDPCSLSRRALEAGRRKIFYGTTTTTTRRPNAPESSGRKRRSAQDVFIDVVAMKKDAVDSVVRKKRSGPVADPYSTTSTTASTTTTNVRTTAATQSADNVTVDRPGYGSCEYKNKNFGGMGECNKWYQRNGLIFEMYYESLQVRTYTQSGTYNLVTMLSDVGGHAGLWLGISIVSLVEFIALFFMCCNKLIRGKKIVVEDAPISGEVANREARGAM